MNITEEAQSSIRHYVWSGFYESDEIVEILCEDIFEPGELDENWVREQLDSEFARKHLDETTWASPTDCDRLDQAFAELEENHIIALQNAGYTQSEGMEDVTEAWHAAGEQTSDIVGYCFYHGQDLERAVIGEGVMLTFGDILGTDEVGLKIGETIAQVLTNHGFNVEWDHSIKKRINIPEFVWRKRSVNLEQ